MRRPSGTSIEPSQTVSMIKTRADVIRWANVLIEHHMVHAAEDESVPNHIKVDPVELIQAAIALETEGFGLPTDFTKPDE